MNSNSTGRPSSVSLFNTHPSYRLLQTPQQPTPPQRRVPVDGVDLSFNVRHESGRLTLRMSGRDAPTYQGDMLVLLMEFMTPGCTLLPHSNKGEAEFCFQILGDPDAERSKFEAAISAMTCAVALGDTAQARTLMANEACQRALAAGAVITSGGQAPLGSAPEWECEQFLSDDEAKDLVALAVRLVEWQFARGASPAAGLRVLLTALSRMQSFEVTGYLVSNCAGIALQHPGFFAGPTGEMFCHCMQDLLNDPKMADSATRQKIRSVREQLLGMHAGNHPVGGPVCFKLLLQSRLGDFNASRSDLTKTLTQGTGAYSNASLGEWERDYQEVQRLENECDGKLGEYLHAYHQACLATGNTEGANWVIQTLQGLSGDIASSMLRSCLDLQTAKAKREPSAIMAELNEQGCTIDVDVMADQLNTVSGYEPGKHAQLVLELAQALWGSPIALGLINYVLHESPADDHATTDSAYGMLVQSYLDNLSSSGQAQKLDTNFENLLLAKANAGDAQAQRHFLDLCRAIGRLSPDMALRLLDKAWYWKRSERATLRLELAQRTESIECLFEAIDSASLALKHELEQQLETAASGKELIGAREHWAAANRLLKALHYAATTVEYCSDDRQICEKYGQGLIRKLGKSMPPKGIEMIHTCFEEAPFYGWEASIHVLWSLRDSKQVSEKKLNKLLATALSQAQKDYPCSKDETIQSKIIYACTGFICNTPMYLPTYWQWVGQSGVPQTLMEMTDHLIKSPSTNPAVAHWVIHTFAQVSSMALGCVLFDMGSKEGAQRRNFIEKALMDKYLSREHANKWAPLMAYASCRANYERGAKDSSAEFSSFFGVLKQRRKPDGIKDFITDLFNFETAPTPERFWEKSLDDTTSLVALQLRAVNPQSSLNDPHAQEDILNRYTEWATELSTAFLASYEHGGLIRRNLIEVLNSPVFPNGEAKSELILQRHRLLADIFAANPVIH